MTRRLAHLIARGVIGVLLFAQLAIAAYACPALSWGAMDMDPAASMQMAGEMTTNVNASADAATQAPPCGDMVGMTDAGSPNLCAEHCKFGQQSDHASTLTIPVVLLAPLLLSPWAPEATHPPRPAAASLSALVAASPPHAILHCVYRT
ncbi:hypothetical protein ACSFA8_26340 [Variovorax sp. RT4R15]|uniref:hypothetical protein n=1 Tax=Variovorax sp. RT4R15 TaxID=3443737 RepID=UPI003F48C2AF